METHRLDTTTQVFFYLDEFYPLSNFAAFDLEWRGIRFPTSEHAYHWEKFEDSETKELIRNARSAHDAFKIAQTKKDKYRPNWEEVKLAIMREILRAKAEQHPYVLKKLLQTGNREIVEDSWRDDFWGWGPNKDGNNWLGKLWMELREEYKNKQKE